ncbi:MAG: excisionase family DNA binding protein [Psychroserpens sp.]|jgi:excisionase family DNA binding protein
MKNNEESLSQVIEAAVLKAFERLNYLQSDGHHRPKDNKAEEYLDINGASSLTKLAKQTIYGKVSKREIPHIKNGSKLVFSTEDLKEWMNSGKRKLSPKNEDKYAF